jgi:hypothetical protein
VPFLANAAFGIAALLVVSSLGGLVLPSTYAADTATWAAQAVAQDWINLLVIAPLLVRAGMLAREGSRAWLLILGGLLAYAVYNFLLYAFAVHFNGFFLVYCAVLGLSSFALATLAGSALREDTGAWFRDGAPVRLAAAVQVLTAMIFGVLWLADVLGAYAGSGRPASLGGEDLFTNPVHVIDISLILPAFLVSGYSISRRRPLGFLLSPILLTFSAVMALTLAFVQLFLLSRGLPGAYSVAAAMFALGALSALALIRLLSDQGGRTPRR